jgi:hypothetical protein
MTDLVLSPTVIAGERLQDDYCVKHAGRSVGRIRRADERTGRWDWVINPPLPIPTWGVGRADSLEAAKAAFRSAWTQFYEQLKPLDVAHWHHHQDAAEERAKRLGWS